MFSYHAYWMDVSIWLLLLFWAIIKYNMCTVHSITLHAHRVYTTNAQHPGECTVLLYTENCHCEYEIHWINWIELISSDAYFKWFFHILHNIYLMCEKSFNGMFSHIEMLFSVLENCGRFANIVYSIHSNCNGKICHIIPIRSTMTVCDTPCS